MVKAANAVGFATDSSCPTMKLSRLWQPDKPLFWLMLAFNVLSSLCTWAMRALPLSTAALLLVGTLALGNVALGLLAAWRLMRDD